METPGFLRDSRPARVRQYLQHAWCKEKQLVALCQCESRPPLVLWRVIVVQVVEPVSSSFQRSAGVTKKRRHQNSIPRPRSGKKNWNKPVREPAVKRIVNRASGSAAGSSGICPTAAPQTAMSSRVRIWRSGRGEGERREPLLLRGLWWCSGQKAG